MNNSLQVINQLFEMQYRLKEMGKADGFERNFRRLYSIFEEEGFVIQDPTDEIYNDSRTDCEASISGALSSKMKITKTLKPIIYKKSDDTVQLLQKAIVIVEKK